MRLPLAPVEQRLGRAVREVRPVDGPFGSDHAAVLDLGDGDEVFVKASFGRADVQDLRIGAVLAAELPPRVGTPPVRVWFEEDGWFVLCLDAVGGAPPAQPWTSGDVDAVLAGMAVRAAELTPSPVRKLRGVADLVECAHWRDLAAGGTSAVAPTPWQRDNLDRLAELESGWEAAVDGRTLLHFDPRPGNFLIDGGTAWVLDWARACTGAAWVDPVAFLAAVDDPEPRFRAHPTAATAQAEDVDAFLAALSGHWADGGRADLAERATDWLRARG